MLNYGEVVGSSFNIIKKNPILFLPNILMIITSLSLLFLFFQGSGIYDLLTTKSYLIEDKVGLFEELDQLSQRSRFTLSVLAWLVGELVLGAFFLVSKFGLIRDLIQGRKPTLKDNLKFVETHYFKYWMIHFVSTLILFGPVFVFFFVYLLLISNTVIHFSLGSFMLGAFGIVWLVYFFWMSVRLFYIYPVMSFEKDTFFKSFKDEFHYVKTHALHTLMSVLIFIALAFSIWLANTSVDFFGSKVSGSVIVAIITLLMVAFEIFVTTLEHVFIFKSYEEGKHIKTLVKKAIKTGRYVPKKAVSKIKRATSKKTVKRKS